MTADPSPSLASRLAARFATASAGRDSRAGIAVALLLAAAPLVVWAGARWTQAGVVRDAAAIRATAAPRLALIDARGQAHAELDALFDRPGVAATLDALARALPSGAMLVRAGRGADGRLAAEVSAADPDRLRAALRRHPATQRLRDTGQRRGDAAMLVTLEEPR
ncbi:hypothetical protein [Sphingomonas sp.]|uniref:hypothetical protein n=1 Tax=Sphingomonas sp. TaxID=28214 RepID=UPI002DD621B8|nr:hypothetical protein [Sphingomonas sp.]